MGCANSKQKRRCQHCHQSAYSPVSRSYSMHVHHPSQTKGDSYHVVALTSSTLGSLKLDPSHQNKNLIDDKSFANGHDHIDKENVIGNGHKHCHETEKENGMDDKEEFSMGLIEAKTWSNLIDQKIPKVVPKTPIRTPPGEPEIVNAWELMEGLEDISPLRSPTHHLRSFSFDVVRNPCSNPMPISLVDRPKSKLQENGNASPNNKPIWLQLADDDRVNSNSLIPQFDPQVISAFRKSFGDLKSEGDPFHFLQVGAQRQPPWDGNALSCEAEKVSDVVTEYKKEKDRVVLYFTSLRGVRKTYEDCCHVRVILKSVGVRVDERDVSMHSGFKEELKELLKDGFSGATLPRVFLGNKYIGGADEIRQLHEDGKLEKLLESCEKLGGGGGGCGGGGGVCDACGDIRFVPCETCSGSCKVFYEDADRDKESEQEQEEDAEEGESGFQRCSDCNENGLIRCPICCH